MGGKPGDMGFNPKSKMLLGAVVVVYGIAMVLQNERRKFPEPLDTRSFTKPSDKSQSDQ